MDELLQASAAAIANWLEGKNELVHHQRYATRTEASIREYVEIFYNSGPVRIFVCGATRASATSPLPDLLKVSAEGAGSLKQECPLLTVHLTHHQLLPFGFGQHQFHLGYSMNF